MPCLEVSLTTFQFYAPLAACHAANLGFNRSVEVSSVRPALRAKVF